MQSRFASHGHHGDEIAPPASFNQLPNPEGDWTENHQKKQSKYNAVLGVAVAVFAGTVLFVSTPRLQHVGHIALPHSALLFQVKESGIIFFNAYLPETYE